MPSFLSAIPIPILIIGFVIGVCLLFVPHLYRGFNRRCVACGRHMVPRVAKVYQLDPPSTFLFVGDDAKEDWFAVFIFKNCTCGYTALDRSYNRQFCRWRLRWIRWVEPSVFLHDPGLFIEARIPFPPYCKVVSATVAAGDALPSS